MRKEVRYLLETPNYSFRLDNAMRIIKLTKPLYSHAMMDFVVAPQIYSTVNRRRYSRMA